MRFRVLLAASLLALSFDSASDVFSLGTANSVAVGERIEFFAARAEAPDGTGLPGRAYRFETDPTCGTFEGSAAAEGTTDADGVALAPPFTALALTLACRTSFFLEGAAEPVDMSVHVFSPENVVLAAVPQTVPSEVGAEYTFEIRMTESGLPVNAFPLTLADISTSPSGSSGSFIEGIARINSGIATARMQANDKQGKYEITVAYRTIQLVVPVVQRVPTGRP